MLLRAWLRCSFLSLFLLAPAALFAETSERWRCEIDMKLGPDGKLELVRTGDRVEGQFIVTAGDRTMRSRVKGGWSGEMIWFRRYFANTSHLFRGVAPRVEDRVRMAGRYAKTFTGIWSAECSRVGPRPVRVEPVRARPAPPPRPVPANRPATCSISGQLKGSPVDLFFAILYGPNNQTKDRASTNPDSSGRYRFTKLPDGKYWIRWDTKADVMSGTYPREQSVICRGKAITGVDFEIR